MERDVDPAGTRDLLDRLKLSRAQGASLHAEFIGNCSSELKGRIVKSGIAQPADAGKLSRIQGNHPHLRLVVNRDADLFAVPRKYDQGTSGRLVSTGTRPLDSRSIWIASDSPQGRRPYATLRKWPSVVRQRLAKPGRSATAMPARKSLSVIRPDYHRTVIDYATPFGYFTERCKSGDNGGMGINALADIRRENLRRLRDSSLYKGNMSAVARDCGKPAVQLIGLVRLNSGEKGARHFGDKMAYDIEASVGLKIGQLSIPNSPLEMIRDRMGDQAVTAQLQDEIREATTEEKRALLEVMQRIRSERAPDKRRRRG